MSAGVVIERPVVELLTLQAYDATGGEWVDLHEHATEVAVRRGGQQDGAAVKTHVGTLDATLYGALNLARVAMLRPNSPIRVVRPPAAPRTAWDLQPPESTDYHASKAMATPRAVPAVDKSGAETTVRSSTYNYAGSRDTQMFYLGGTEALTVRAGTIIAHTPNTAVGVDRATNPKPVGTFYQGEPFTVRGEFANTLTTVAVIRIVVFTGEALNPTILAQSPAFTPEDRNGEVSWTFTAPASSDWQLGLMLDQDAATGTATGFSVGVRVARLRVVAEPTPRPEFTGTVSDLYQSVELDKSTGERHTYTTVEAVDSVQSLANTDRYGVVARNGAGYQSFADRIAQLATSSRVPIDAPTFPDVTVYDQHEETRPNWGWSNEWPTLSSPLGWSMEGYDNAFSVYAYDLDWYTPAATDVTGLEIEQRFIQSLQVGRGHVASLTVEVPELAAVSGLEFVAVWRSASGETRGESFKPTAAGVQTLLLRFSPPDPTGKLVVLQRGTARLTAPTSRLAVAIKDTRVFRVGAQSSYVLQDVAYESTLLNHFDLACNSVGARWSVTKRGNVVFRQQDEDVDPVARFSDTAAGDVSYTDVGLSYDTRNVVNSLKLNQHGYDPATGDAADSSQTYTDEESIAEWGARAGELDTCLYLGSPHQADAELRAREVTDSLRLPAYSVRSFTFNAQSNPELLDALELGRTIAVDYETIRQRARVLTIEHAVSPTRWMVTVTVHEPRVGPRFGDVNAVFDATTFAEVNRALATKTFGDVDAMPFDPQETP
ncbi:hypothetical protein HQQ88_08250 [Curtobacterium sp. VKM Ac-2861]|uniref:hypothetical protein n=1 Tax=Curtobacterium sp. VKM Ac-2861 TaxID=2739016 RepID=UPI0015650631|nr:hypothetical protein [Curtobacterium sp. VKM Ac-2861]